jgi:pimeloyl-ACP methyl ester carboxylesterase
VYLNVVAPGLDPVDLSGSEEFASLLASAADLGVPVEQPVRYQARNLVVNGLRFHLLEWGEPSSPSLFFLHGGNQTAHSWDLVSVALAHRFHIVAVDQRGHGDSEWPRDGEGSIGVMADDARQLIERMNLERPVVFGHSMGGMVTMTLLLAHPSIARAAVLVDIGPEISRHGAERIRDFVRGAREFASTEEFVEQVAGYDPFRPREHIRRTVRYNLMQRADGRFVSKHDARRWATTRGEEELPHGLSLDEARRIECPVLVVRGEHSKILLPDAAERFVATLPDGRLVTVPRCGHNVHSQNTLGFLDAVHPFLDGLQWGRNSTSV